MYCVNENGKDSTVSAFRYYPESGKVLLINKESAAGEDPCYIIHNELHVLIANYESGSIAVFARKPDGSLTEAIQVIRHEGQGVDLSRQDKPHTHLVQFSPDGKLVLATNLGNDTIYIYRYDPHGPTILSLRDTLAVTPGSGPRHIVFHPHKCYFYLITELSATIEVFNFENETAVLTQQIPLDGENRAEYRSGGDIRLSHDGKFLYATNRGKANTVTVFKVADIGNLNIIQQLDTQGDSPRNISIEPTGSYLLIAHENSDNITVFRCDKSNGTLSLTDKSINICKPVFLAFTTITKL